MGEAGSPTACQRHSNATGVARLRRMRDILFMGSLLSARLGQAGQQAPDGEAQGEISADAQHADGEEVREGLARPHRFLRANQSPAEAGRIADHFSDHADDQAEAEAEARPTRIWLKAAGVTTLRNVCHLLKCSVAAVSKILA